MFGCCLAPSVVRDIRGGPASDGHGSRCIPSLENRDAGDENQGLLWLWEGREGLRLEHVPLPPASSDLPQGQPSRLRALPTLAQEKA